jgi:hypothetical protein
VIRFRGVAVVRGSGGYGEPSRGCHYIRRREARSNRPLWPGRVTDILVAAPDQEAPMRFARAVFWIAGLYGFLSLPPLYFLFNTIGRRDPPPITHPQFFYGFVGVSLAFQVVFWVIAADPARFRPMMIPAVLEKLSYAAAVAALWLGGRMTAAQSATALPDSILMVLFAMAFFKTRPPSSRVWIPNVRIF